jgi:uncharacterized membrane protein YfcA
VGDFLIAIPLLMLTAFAHGAFGFGFPLFSTPLLTLGIDIRTAILVTLVPTVVINTVSVLAEKEWKEAIRQFWLIPLFTIIGSYCGTKVLFAFDPDLSRILLALMVIGYLLSDYIRGVEKERIVPMWGLALFGLVIGFSAGIVNVFAPLIIIFALETKMKPELMVTTFNISFLTSKSGQIAGFVSQGAFHGPALVFSLLMLPLIIISLWIGIRLRKRLDMDAYKKLLRVVLWVVAIMLIGQGGFALTSA